MGNMKIGKKLQLMNLALIVTVLIATSLSFHFLSARYVVNQAKQQMRSDAESILQSIKGMQQLSQESVTQRLIRWNELKQTGRALNSKIVIFNTNNTIVYTNADTSELQMLKKLVNRDDSMYLMVRRTIAAGGETKGSILIANKIKDIGELNRMLGVTLIFSLLIGGIISLFVGYLLGRGISRPIRSLTAGMRQFSPKREIPRIAVHTRDELKELADSFLDMAEKLRVNDRIQIEFLQNASHELKTPLMAIQGNAEAIKDGIVQGSEAADSLDVIIGECQRLKSVVNELILLSKIDQASESYDFKPVKIASIITDAISGLQAVAGQKGIAVTITGDEEASGLFDRDKLTRAFINIFGNAVRYARAKIAVNVSDTGGRLEISCADDGKGFAPGEEKRIFDRFYKGEQGGTGIGLAITKAIVEAHGGSIEARQGIPTGAVIRVILLTTASKWK